MTIDRYVTATRDRFERPRNTKRWYRCRCGRWHGINKSCLCFCNAFPPSWGGTSKQRQADSDREQVRILESLGRHDWADTVRSFL